jgi:GR25 family glycosyltransferase involved in LPS biosynthesis
MKYGLEGFNRVARTTAKWFSRLLRVFERQKRIDWTKYIDDTVVIHLAYRKDRLKIAEKRASSQKLKGRKTLLDHLRFFDAIEGKRIKWFSKKIHINKYPFSFHWEIDPSPGMKNKLKRNNKILCSSAETGIAFSHYRIWKEIVENKTPVTLIMEDDFEFCHKFQDKIESIFEKELPNDWDLLYLSSLPNQFGFTWDPHSQNLSRLYNGVWWLSGYVLTYEGAKKLLEGLPIVGPVDVWINYQFKNMEVYMTNHNLITQGDDTKSDNTYSYVETFKDNLI